MDEQLYYSFFQIENFNMLIIGTTAGLLSLKIVSEKTPLLSDYIRDDSMFRDAAEQISEYIHGERKTFDIKIFPQGTAFQKKVWKVLLDIPYGGLRTYGDIAAALGKPKAARAVGMANNKNPLPIIIPCHRVVGANGKLTGYAYGLEMKQQLISMEKTVSLYDALYDYYGPQGWWPADNAFEMMAGSILVQNTAWRNVEKALARFNGRLSPEYIENIPLDDLTEVIRPCGFYMLKAARLKNLTAWFKTYGYSVKRVGKKNSRELRKELISIHGIGRETADSILLYALNKACFVIDSYTRRIFERVGIITFQDYDKFRMSVENTIPGKPAFYNEFHALLIAHGKSYCRKKPQCGECPVKKLCLHGSKSGI